MVQVLLQPDQLEAQLNILSTIASNLRSLVENIRGIPQDVIEGILAGQDEEARALLKRQEEEAQAYAPKRGYKSRR